MKSPLISVVIPTCGRPAVVPRAVSSALKGMGDDVEVIVVPNGPDDSWKQSMLPFANDQRVRVAPIAASHGSVARNHGQSMARGEFIRFLDDDDYLFPRAAKEQLSRAIEQHADVSSGGVTLVDRHGQAIRQLCQPPTLDFVAAMLGPERATQTLSHILRRRRVLAHTWDETLSVRQDTDWMLRFCTDPSLTWHRFDEPIGAWVQHRAPRVSRGNDPGAAALRHTAQTILFVTEHLQQQGALNAERRRAAADGLWSTLQKGVLYEQSFWFDVARKARELSADSRPPSQIYKLPILARLDPLSIALALIPMRWCLQRFRQFAFRAKKNA